MADAPEIDIEVPAPRLLGFGVVVALAAAAVAIAVRGIGSRLPLTPEQLAPYDTPAYDPDDEDDDE